MIISIPKECIDGETRVAATPETVKKFVAAGMEVRIEHNAGENAGYTDAEYKDSGAIICEAPAELYNNADIILKINAPQEQELPFIKRGAIVLANFQALADKARLSIYAKAGLTCFALDLMPRISRAQNMDILSSQSNLAGYAAVLEAFNTLNKAAPLMMTAAGTVPPAKVLVLGAGVAGLQAIATAKRLGAQVFASDVRPAVKEQVESLGAKFVEVDSNESFETVGGYAKETSEEYKRKQAEAVAEQLTKTDVAITTALIPGKKAPILITKKMLAAMPKGAVIVDMASASGGNIEGSINAQTVELGGVKIIGNSNLAAKLPASASALFARNIYNFLAPMMDKKGRINFNFDDELVAGTCAVRNGEVLK